MPKNPDQTITTKTLAAMIICAVVIGVGCACGFDIVYGWLKSLIGHWTA